MQSYVRNHDNYVNSIYLEFYIVGLIYFHISWYSFIKILVIYEIFDFKIEYLNKIETCKTWTIVIYRYIEYT